MSDETQATQTPEQEIAAGIAALESEKADAPQPAAPDDLTSIKKWVRRELFLRGSGYTEAEREKMNP